MSDSIGEITLPEARSLGYFFRRQPHHLFLLVGLVGVTWYFVKAYLGDGSLLGISDTAWFWTGIAVAVVHQVFVWASWRAQLGWALWTRWFGDWDMTVFAVLFFPLILARPLLVVMLGMADAGSLPLGTGVPVTVGSILLLPALYTFWSVAQYFGFWRAAGGDHFRVHYRKMGLVRQGIFRWCMNSMYSFGMLFLWSLALFANSAAALGLAFFYHAYVWVHFFCTEQPDLELIYAEE